jgi:hypothetical protein
VRNSVEYPLTRVTYRELYKYTSSAQVHLPRVYAIKGRKVVIRPVPSSGVTIKIWYPKAPETLVMPQGRITGIDAGFQYVSLDAVGEDLTAATADLGAFVNLVDAQTGEIKVSLQTSLVNQTTKRLSFKASGLTYPTVYNRTIATAVTDTVEVNDYVCGIRGTCVPDLPDSCLDFLVQYAVYEIRRRMGEAVQDEAAMLNDLEREVERQWAGREVSRRIANKSRAWK